LAEVNTVEEEHFSFAAASDSSVTSLTNVTFLCFSIVLARGVMALADVTHDTRQKWSPGFWSKGPWPLCG